MNWLTKQSSSGPIRFVDDVEHRRFFDQLFENRIAMEPKNFADVVLGVSRDRVGFLLRQHEYVRNVLARRIQPANLDHPRMHRAAIVDGRESANDKETLLSPFALAFSRKHHALSFATESAMAVPAKNCGSALR